MMKNLTVKLALSLGLWLNLSSLSLAGNNVNKSVDESQLVKNVILRQVQAANQENINEYFKTIYPGSPDEKVSRQLLSNVFKVYDLKFTVNKIDILELKPNLARIRVIATAYKIRGPKFKNNTTTTIARLKKINGQWKTFDSKVENVKYNNNVATANSIPSTPKKSTTNSAELPKIKQLFVTHFQALNKEDLTGYMNTLDPKSAAYQTTRKNTQNLFKNYDLRYDLKNLNIVEVKNNQAIVRMTGTTKKIKGGNFQNSKIITLNTLRKVDGKWLISNTKVEKIDQI